MSKVKCLCNVRESVMLAPGVFSLWIDAPEIAESAVPGQFVSIYTKSEARLLPRPISICEINRGEKTMRFVYRVVGEGTEEFSKLSSGDKIEVLGPLGNGFPIPEKKAILIGGGIGIPPMLALAQACKERPTVVLGYRDATLFLKEEFDKVADVVIATDDGSVYKSSDNGAIGVKGTVMDAIRQYGIEGTEIYACGPTPMLRAIQSYALEHGIEAQLSLEERMACGVGACLACVCKSKEIDDHSQVKNKRVCKDGPVFYAEEVEL